MKSYFHENNCTFKKYRYRTEINLFQYSMNQMTSHLKIKKELQEILINYVSASMQMP